MSTLRRTVFDTGTLVSAALRVGSIPHRALSHAFSAGEVCVSATTLVELEAVLLRDKFDRYQPVQIRQEFLAVLRQRGVLVQVSAADEVSVQPPCRDPMDHPFLALVQRCNADVLISSDGDLLVLHPWQGIPILTPAAFLEQVSA